MIDYIVSGVLLYGIWVVLVFAVPSAVRWGVREWREIVQKEGC
jgi:hypothetical protein